MSQPLPVLLVAGSVREVTTRSVAPAESVPLERDDSGRVIRQPRDARPGYDVLDVVVLTDDGGFVTVILKADALEAARGGVVPERGERVEWPVWVSLEWVGPPTQRRTRPRFSVPTDVLVSMTQSGRKNGERRLAPASAAAAS